MSEEITLTVTALEMESIRKKIGKLFSTRYLQKRGYIKSKRMWTYDATDATFIFDSEAQQLKFMMEFL